MGESAAVLLLRAFEAMFNGWLRAYEWSLDKVIRHKFITLVITLATIAGTVYLYYAVPKGFFPPEDTGFLVGVTEGPTDTSFEAMVARQRQVVEIVRADPAVEFVNSTVGAGGPNPTTNYGRMFVGLKPKKEREPARVSGLIERDPDMGVDRLTSLMLDYGSGHAVGTCSTRRPPGRSALASVRAAA